MCKINFIMTTETPDIIELARQWLTARRNGDVEGIEILPQQTSNGLVVWYYWEETWEDLPYFLTVPMVKDLLGGKNPKKVRNEYTRKPQESIEPTTPKQ